MPPSPAQERAWFREAARPGGAMAHVMARWALSGDIRPARIETALRRIVARHEVLRTGFAAPGGRLQPRVHRTARLRLAQVELRNLPPRRRAPRAEAIASEFAAQPFDLARPPLLRAALLRTGGQRGTLVVVAHRLVFDDGSAALLTGELAALMDEDMPGAGDAEALPELTLHYRDYARRRAAPDRAVRVALEDAAGLAAAAASVTTRHELDPGLGQRLRLAARSTGETPCAVAAAAFAAALHRVTGEPDLCLDVAVCERCETALKPLIGAFDAAIPLRLRAGPGASLSDLVARAGRVIGAVSGQGRLPVDHAPTPSRSPGRPHDGPRPGIGFGLLDLGGAAVSRGGVRLAPLATVSSGTGNRLDAMLVGSATGWSLMVAYDPGRVAAERVEGLGAAFAAALDAVVDAPSTTLAALARPDAGTGHRAGPVARPAAPAARSRARSGNLPDKPAVTRFWEVIALAPGTVGGPIAVCLNHPSLYRAMAASCAPRMRVVNLRLASGLALDGGGAAVREQLLAQAAALVAQHTAGRPAALIGHGASGLLAHEVTRRLAATPARQAPLLAMIDSWPADRQGAGSRFSGRRVWRAARARRWTGSIGRLLKGWAGLSAGLRDAGCVDRPPLAGGVRPATAEADRRARAAEAWLAALFADMQAEPHDGETLMFALSRRSRGAAVDGLGWEGLVPADTAIHWLPAGHEATPARDAAPAIAAVLGARLARRGGPLPADPDLIATAGSGAAVS